MQVSGVGILWIVAAVSLTMVMLGLAYFMMTAYSHRRIIQTQQTKLEEVRKSEEKYKSLFDNSLAGILRFSTDTWTVLDSNAAVRAMFRCNGEAELEQCFTRFRASSLDFIRDSLARKGAIEQYEIQAARKDGEEVWILFSARATPTDHAAQAVIVDITERKRHEEKIEEQGALLDQTQDAIVVVDPQSRIIYWNSGGETMYGWKSQEVIGRSMRELLYEESESVRFEAAMEDIRQFNEWSGEQFHRRKDGKRILVESRWKTVRKKSNGQLNVLIVSSDITEKKRMESRFIRAQRMESIALLTGGLAHDLQNVLAPIDMSVHLLKKRAKSKSTLAIVNAVEESARNGLKLLRNILTYGKGTRGERMEAKIVPLLEEVLAISRRQSPASIRVEKNLDHQKWPILADADQMRQVFLNLFVNAMDAMPTGGVLKVEAMDIEMTEDLLAHFPDAEAGPHVVVSVTDTGNGIPQEEIDKIFEPFYTTKESSGGTGLGLSIAHGIVRSHDGFIAVTSKVGEGATFRVYLPAHVD